MEDIQLIHGDCLIEMQNIPDKSVDAIICDLPYGQLNKSNKHAAWDVVIPFEALWEQYKRIIKDNGAIVLFAQGMFTAQLMMSNPKMWRYNLIWQKGGRCSGFLNAKRQPLREHEDICVFYKKQPTYNPQMVKCLPHQRNHSRGKMEKEQTNRCYGKFGKAVDIITNLKYPKSILNFKRPHPQIHPTEKPVALLEYLINTYTNDGHTVLDNCMGSGSCGVAAVNTHRKFIGIELEGNYFNIAKQRIDEAIREKNEKTLFD